MGVPIRHIFAAAMTFFCVPADAAEKAIGFSGVVPGAPIWPARATIASFVDRAAIDLVVANPGNTTATIRLRTSPGATVSQRDLRLPPGGFAKIRAFIDLDDDAARQATVCAIIPASGAQDVTTQTCGSYIARRFDID